MKTYYLLIVVSILVNCASTKIVDTWKNKDYLNYQPNKVLVIGITDNLTARRIFEEQLKSALNRRGIDAVESYYVFDTKFTDLQQTEDAIQNEVNKLDKEGFDAILISTVKGVDEKTSYSGDTYYRDTYNRRFGRYYYSYQNIYYDRGYYDKYKVYHIESSL